MTVAIPPTPWDLSDHPAVAAWAKSTILPVSRVGRQDLWARGKMTSTHRWLADEAKDTVASSRFRAFGRIPPAFAMSSFRNSEQTEQKRGRS